MSVTNKPSQIPRIAVIGTGGTFAMQARHAFDWVEYGESGIVRPIDDLLDALGDTGIAAELVPVSFRTLPSTGVTPQDWLELARLIDRTAKEDASIAGFVVTHGTATLEETAWFLDCALQTDLPVVLTGAQRPANTTGSDALANLRTALAAACMPEWQGIGVLVAMDGTLFAARDVVKSASFDLHAFESPASGPLGRVDADGRVVLRHRPVPARKDRPALNLSAVQALPRVDIAVSYAGADGTAIDAAVAAGARGIVSMGLAPGRPANGEREALARAAKQGVCVVQSTRAVRPVVPPQDFLRRDGVLAGGDLAPHKLRILLMLLLACGVPAGAMQEKLLAY
jgi:L-asparaginase